MEEGYDSRIANDGIEYVVFDRAQVLPCLLVTYAPFYVKAAGVPRPLRGPAAADGKAAVTEQTAASFAASRVEPAPKYKFDDDLTERELRRRKEYERANPGVHFYQFPGVENKWVWTVE